MTMRNVLFALVLGACGGGSGDDTVMADAPSGPMCTGAVFDVCAVNTDCMSMNCHFYMQSNFSVCTQACTPGDNSTCPVDSSGVNGVCNNMGNCKPAAPNNCHL